VTPDELMGGAWVWFAEHWWVWAASWPVLLVWLMTRRGEVG
jgi:hypothetical protein